MLPAKDIFSYRKHWAARFGTAPFLPMTREEMEALGWDSCDVILISGDAYVDHPSFGMAIVGRLLEAQGFRVGMICQPDWQSAEDFKRLGRPNLFFGVTAGNMDSMVNRYTSDRRVRSDDAYTPGGQGGKRPDRSVIVYSQRAREAFSGVPIVVGGIEASLRRIAHFDYWSEKVRRSILLDAKADLLVFGNAERQIVEIAHRMAAGESIRDITDLRGTCFVRNAPAADWIEIDSTTLDTPGKLNPPIDPYASAGAKALGSENSATNTDGLTATSGTSAIPLTAITTATAAARDGAQTSTPCRANGSAAATDDAKPAEPGQVGGSVNDLPNATLARDLATGYGDGPTGERLPVQAVAPCQTRAGAVNTNVSASANASVSSVKVVKFYRQVASADRGRSVVRIPAYEQVRDDAVLYAHASRILHLESNPGNARALVQRHGDVDVWLNPPPLPLTTKEMDATYELPYRRVPHPAYGDEKIPAYEMIRFSISIQRGCFGGCTFCSITEHEGRIIQNRSEDSIVREIETVRDTVPGFTGVISDLGGPTANMYRLACKSPTIESACRRPSCVYPGICPNLNTNHAPLIQLYRRARALKGVKKILIGSGVRYDLAVESPEYVKELVQHHVGGYLKIAPEAIGEGPLSKMMKPGVGSYYRFKELFDRYSKEAGKEQYLIPYFIAAHPGTTNEDMLELALWLKKHGYRADQVQAFLPSPMATATAMYHSGKNPLRRITRSSEAVAIPRGLKIRRLHKAFLRWHDANNWPMLREALIEMGRADLIGGGKHHLIPPWQPAGTGDSAEGARRPLDRKYRGKAAAVASTGTASPLTAGAPRPATFRTQHTGFKTLPLPKQKLRRRNLSK